MRPDPLNAPAKAAGASNNESDLSDPSFSQAVIDWQRRHGRHTLPWQRTRDAYRVWLSEIMLQQTQVAAVIPYYERFLQRFPDVATLAAATQDEVMAYWSGLGYYSRARNLHQCAKRVVAEHGGVFPADPASLADLPGIGRSTAAAIAAFSYGVKAAILDGNVKRVFARVFGVEGYPGAKPVEDKLWLRANALLPQEGIEAYTQGLMDLGATLCTRTRPACERCPLADRCVARASGRVHELPQRKPKKTNLERYKSMLVITHGNAVLLEQRSDMGIWGGLLSLPEIDALEYAGATEKGPPETIERVLRANTLAFGELQRWERLQAFSHGFTHFKLHVTPYLLQLAQRQPAVAQAGHVWWEVERLAQAPLPAPVRKLLQALFAPSLLPVD